MQLFAVFCAIIIENDINHANLHPPGELLSFVLEIDVHQKFSKY